MLLTDVIASAQNGDVTRYLAQLAGVDNAVATKVVAEVTPEFSNAIERNTLSRGGLADLVRFMGQSGLSGLFEAPQMLQDKALQGAIEQRGIAALDLMFGSKDKSRAVAQRVSRLTGVDEAKIRDLLPYLAAVAIGGLAHQTKAAFGDIFQRHPHIDATQTVARAYTSPGSGTWPGGNLGGGTDGSSAEQSGGGGAGTQFPTGGDIPQQVPLPIPGQSRGGYGGEPPRTPYDDLSDILRRGGFGGGQSRPAPQPAPSPFPQQSPQQFPQQFPGGGPSGADGGLMWNIVRSILGSVLGFQNRGLMGWIVQAIVVRYGWRILQFILRRVVLGR